MPRLPLKHDTYHGWHIWIDGKRPAGYPRFRALRDCDALHANTLEALKRMIDNRAGDPLVRQMN